jgi:hypothetical protein
MKLQAHFLADTAQFDSEGFITVIRGGVTSVAFEGFPGLARFCVLTRLWLTAEEADGLVFMTMRLSFDGTEIGKSSQPINVNRSNPDHVYVNVISNLQLSFPSAGTLRIEASVRANSPEEAALPLLDLLVEAAPGSQPEE